MTPTNLDGLFFRITYETIGKKDDETCIFAEDKRHLSITSKQARCSAFDLHYLCKKLITSKYETNNLYSFISYRYLARLLSQEADEHFPRRHTYLFMVCRHHWCGTEGHGQAYIITDYGVVNDSTIIQTQKIQEVIDRCHANGGGVIVVPAGTYLTGSLFFKPGCNLYLEENATLKGSDAITHYQIVKTRLEGQTLDYFAALINADHHDGFTIAGKGTLNGNGHKFYDESAAPKSHQEVYQLGGSPPKTGLHLQLQRREGKRHQNGELWFLDQPSVQVQAREIPQPVYLRTDKRLS